MGAKALIVTTTLFLAASLLGAPARAQDQAPAPIEDDALSEALPAAHPEVPRRGVARPPVKRTQPDAVETDAPSGGDAAEDASDEVPLARPVHKPASPPPAASGNNPAAPSATAAPESRPQLKPLLVPTAGDAEVLAAWERWHKAQTELDFRGAEAAQRDLLNLKDDLGVTDFESFSDAFLRAAETRRQARDSAGSLALATAAVALAPNFPYSHLGLAEALLLESPFAPASYVRQLWQAFRTFLANPRYGRPVLGDVGASLLFAVLATAVAVVALMFTRRVRYLLHDLHHSFPKPMAPWQSAALTLLMLSLPVLFRLGLLPVLLTLFAAVALYLSAVERVVAGLLLVLLVGVPWAGSALVERTAFAGTVAEDVYLLEAGGLDAKAAAVHVRKRLAEDKAGFQELFALGRYESRRGKLDDAIAHEKLAATQRTNDPRLLTNLAIALMTRGDTDSAAEIYASATQADPTLAAAYFDLAKLYYRRASTMSDQSVGLELDRAQNALSTAQRLDESLLVRTDPPPDNLIANRLLLSPALPLADVLALAESDAPAKVLSELSFKVLGDPDYGSVAWAYAGAALLVMALGFARGKKRISLACEKCGRPVCRRCDPELSATSKICNQCVYAFTRTNAVAPAIKVRKQLEVHRFETRTYRIAYVLGALCSGMGHVFSGFALRGAAYLFLFLFAGSSLFLRQGLLRAPYGPGPFWFRVLPPLLLLIGVYTASLRGLFRTQVR